MSGPCVAIILVCRYYYAYMCYVLPPVLLVGLLGNPLVVAMFAQRRVHVQARLRFYYLLMAVGDWLFLIDWVLPGYLGDSLYFESGGAFYVYVDQLSVASCKVWRAVLPWAYLPSDWTKVCVTCHMSLRLRRLFHVQFFTTAKTLSRASFLISISRCSSRSSASCSLHFRCARGTGSRCAAQCSRRSCSTCPSRRCSHT